VFPSLYVICDADLCERSGWAPVEFAAACVEGGARLLQIRAKRGSSAFLLDLAQSILERTRGSDTAIVVNDRADIARLAGASGVHVGQEDLQPSAVRRIVGDSALVGLSTHTREQIRHAVDEPITYLAIGPVFETATKDTGYRAVGLERVREAASIAGAGGLPVVAIGGITLEQAPAVLAAGAISVVVASDLLAEGDPRQKVKKYLDRLAR
jgi:thiamine-phosphate pyrophosphorylase